MTTFLDKSPNTREPFDPDRFQARARAARAIAVHFGAPITDGLRETAGGGSSTSLHLRSSGGLAFDFGGPDADKERRVCQWAARHPELFQEVMHHDLGFGLHAHVAFESNLQDVEDKVRRALGTTTIHGPKPPKWPGRFLKVTTPSMQGEDVERWQKRMDKRGWDIPTGGTYDRPTGAVCEKFQREKDLGVDGVVGRETWRAAWTEPIT
jgi:putative peptidoglycan binding protein